MLVFFVGFDSDFCFLEIRKTGKLEILKKTQQFIPKFLDVRSSLKGGKHKKNPSQQNTTPDVRKP